MERMSVILRKLGELDGKADGILRELQDIKADNIRCHADRENIYGEIGHVKQKQNWMIGVATGMSLTISAAFTTIITMVRHS